MRLRSNIPLYTSYLVIAITTTCPTFHLHTSSISQVTKTSADESGFGLLYGRNHVLRDTYAILAAGPPGLPTAACCWDGEILRQTLPHTLQVPADAQRRSSESLAIYFLSSLICYHVISLTSRAANASSPPSLWTFAIGCWDHV